MTDLKPYTPPFDLGGVNPNKIASDFKVPIQERPNVPYRNPNANLEKLVEEQTEQIEKIRYENMKLNAQIEVLNKTADSQDTKLDNLRELNADLKATNKILEANNRNYWKKTIICSVAAGIIMLFVGAFSTGVQSWLRFLI